MNTDIYNHSFYDPGAHTYAMWYARFMWPRYDTTIPTVIYILYSRSAL